MSPDVFSLQIEKVEKVKQQIHGRYSQRIRATNFLSLLSTISGVFDDVYIIIDGLDECADRDDLLEFVQRLAIKPMRVMTSSRPVKDIEEAFHDKPSLKMEEKYLQPDIATHIDWSFTNHAGFKNLKPAMKAEIKEELCFRNGGM